MRRSNIVGALFLLTGCLSEEAANRQREADEQAAYAKADAIAQNTIENVSTVDMNAYGDDEDGNIASLEFYERLEDSALPRSHAVRP